MKLNLPSSIPQAEKVLNRRNAIIAGISAGFAGLCALMLSRESTPRPSSLRSAFEQWSTPGTIPHARDVRCIIDEPDAKQLLIHLPQAHYAEAFERQGWRHLNENAASVQSDIREILTAVTRQFPASAILPEGWTANMARNIERTESYDYAHGLEESERSQEETRKMYRDGSIPITKKARADYERWLDNVDSKLRQDRDELVRVGPQQFNRQKANEEIDRCDMGLRKWGWWNLRHNRGVRICPGESDETLARARNVMWTTNATDRTAQEWDTLSRDREEEVVRRTAAMKDVDVIIVPFGSAHDFSGAVQRWNATHPHDHISLMKVTPEHLTEEHDEQELGRRIRSLGSPSEQ